MGRVVAEQAAFLSTLPARQKDRRVALTVVMTSLLVFLCLAPFATRRLPQVWAFIPVYESALIISDFITAGILFIQFNILRSRALLMLACGYLFNSLIVVSHALTFPGLFSSSGLLGAGPQSTAWLYLFWHGGFPSTVIAYALLRDKNDRATPPRETARRALLLGIGAVIAAVVALTLLATAGQAILPPVMVGNNATATLTAISLVICILTLVALLLVRLRPLHTVLDLWLMVVMCVWLCDMGLSVVLNAGRFDLGFYAGRAYGLLAATFVLLVLLTETGALYAQLAAIFETEHIERKREAEGHRRTRVELEWHADRALLFSAAVESSVDAILTNTLDGVITGWNPAAERLFGFTADEAIGKNVEIIVPEDRRAELRGILERIRNGQMADHHETVRRARDGKLIDVSLSVSPIKSPSGAVIGACMIARDVTEEKLAEEKFKLAVEACPNGMLMADHAGLIVMANTEVENMFGYRREELIGQSVDLLVPERFRVQHFVHRSYYAANPTARRVGANRDLYGRRKDGTEFPTEIALNPILTRQGLLTLSAIVDITERKRLDRLKSEFVSTVSHELRTPLTSIAGSLGLLVGTTAGELPERARHLLMLAQSNSKRLVKLVNDILDIEKLESGQVVFRFSLVEIRPLIEQIVEANRGFADTYLVRLRPDIGTDGELWADPDRLSQVVTNLISNAIKFSPPNGEVVVAVEPRGDGLRLSVRDQGEGIPAEFKPRIFQKFAQADGTNTKKTGGTGLGLSIVKEIVGRLGGDVGFTDASGGGTIFYVDLQSAGRSQAVDSAPRSMADLKEIA